MKRSGVIWFAVVAFLMSPLCHASGMKNDKPVGWRDEGVAAGDANIVDVTGTGGTVSVAAGVATLNITGGGEVNTASNLGSGNQVFKDKSGVDLRFRTLTSGDNVTLTTNANDIGVSVVSIPSEDVTGVFEVADGGTGIAALSKGDLLAGVSATAFNRLTVGANGTILTADSSTTTGLNWTTAKSIVPLTTKGDLVVTDGTHNGRLPIGSDGQILTADSASVYGMKWINAPTSGTSAAAWHASFMPQHGKLSSDLTRIDASQTNFRLVYADDSTTKNSATFVGVVPDYYTGGALTAEIKFQTLSSATSNVTWGVAVMAVTSADNIDYNTESYDTENTKTQGVPSTVSRDATMIITLTNKDSIAANDWFKIRVRRVGSDALTGDVAVVGFAVYD